MAKHHGQKSKAETARDAEPQRASDREGDILGISDADPHVQIPKPAKKGSGHAIGLDVRGPATGLADLKPGKGATAIDMGGGGEGNDISSHSSRPFTAEPDGDE